MYPYREADVNPSFRKKSKTYCRFTPQIWLCDHHFKPIIPSNREYSMCVPQSLLKWHSTMLLANVFAVFQMYRCVYTPEGQPWLSAGRSSLWSHRDAALLDCSAPAAASKHHVGLQAVSWPLSLLWILWAGGLQVPGVGYGSPQCPPWHLAAGSQWEQGERSAQWFIRGSVVAEVPPDVQQQRARSSSTGMEKDFYGSDSRCIILKCVAYIKKAAFLLSSGIYRMHNVGHGSTTGLNRFSQNKKNIQLLYRFVCSVFSSINILLNVSPFYINTTNLSVLFLIFLWETTTKQCIIFFTYTFWLFHNVIGKVWHTFDLYLDFD